MVWYGMVWGGMVRYGYGMLWLDKVWCGVVWYGMVRYALILYDIVESGLELHGIVRCYLLHCTSDTTQPLMLYIVHLIRQMCSA